MLSTLKNFMEEEDGLGTVEIVVIVAVLVAIALLFRKKISEFVSATLEKALPDTQNLDSNEF